MSLSGAIPKAQGGARPKIKLDLGTRTKQPRSIPPPADTKLVSKPTFLTDGAYRVGNNLDLIDDIRPTNNGTSKSTFKPSLPGNSDLKRVSEITAEKPLEEREILKSDEGVQIKRQALHPEWVEKRLYIFYARPPLPTDDEELFWGAVEAWVEQMEFLIDDLTWLLNLPYYRFWSQMLYDKSVHECLECYLSAGPRWFEDYPENELCLSMIRSIHQLVFLIYVRMATYKESKSDYITPSVFGELVYNNFLFDICKILDICALYGSTNKSLLEKMISNIFTHQPKYYDDLRDLVSSLNKVMENLEAKLGIFEFSTPLCISNENKHSYEELSDILHYILDTFSSLNSFMLIFPKAAKTFQEKDFEVRLSSFYERVVPTLIDSLTINSENPEDVIWKENLLKQMKIIRLCIISVFRTILSQSCLQFIYSDDTTCADDICKSMETFVHTFTTCVEEKVFIADYNSTYPIDEDVMHYQNRGVDMTTLNFVKEALNSAVAELDLSTESVTSSDNPLAEPIKSESGNKQLLEDNDDTSGMNGYYAGETSTLSDIEITSLVSSVQDLLPDLGNGFVRECLKYYNYSTEEVLNALLENNLPPCLESLDRSLEYSEIISNSVKENQTEIPSELTLKQQQSTDASDVLVNRCNIYDDDEFDIFRSGKVNKNKVYRGKRNKEYEKDPSLTEKMKEIAHQYEENQGFSIYEDEFKYVPLENQTDYDDEYDDTYDDDDAGVADNFNTDRRQFDKFPSLKGKGAFNVKGINFDDTPDEEDQEEEELQQGNKGPVDNTKKANASYKRGWKPQEKSNSMVFNNSKRNGVSNDKDGQCSERSSSEKESERESTGNSVPVLHFQPFCENPEEVRKRRDQTRQAKQFRNKGYVRPRESPQTSRNDENASQQNMAPKVSKHSGKGWRQGTQGDNEDGNRGYRGGKYKEDTNHGKAQDSSHKHKMVHKNEFKRNAAQAKYRSNF